MGKQTKYFRSNAGSIFATDYPEYHAGEERLSNAEGERLYREQCKEQLRKILKPGQTVYCVLRKVSSSGMRRLISLLIVEGGEITCIDYWASKAMGRPCKGNGDGITVNGCGMDMGFELVYSLGRSLWPDGTPAPHSTRNGEPDSSGSYALKHSWL